MPEKLASYKVFIASPSGLEDIRESFKDQLQKYNETDAYDRGVNFRPIGWELTLGGVGRPQELINKDIEDCDYFVLVLHDRWGSPPSSDVDSEYSSGTEEEFYVALDCLKNDSNRMKDILVFFRAVNARQLSDPGEQLAKVLEFKKEREQKKDLLYHSFDTQKNFDDFLHRHLAKWVRGHEEENGNIQQSDVSVDASMSPIANVSIETKLREDNGLEKAQSLVQEKRYVEAEIEFSNLITKGNNPEALALYGRFLRKLGQLERAESIVVRALEQSHSESEMQIRAFAMHQLARVFEEQGRFNDSVKQFRKAIALFDLSKDLGGAAKSSRNLAKVLKKMGLLDEAESELEEAIEFYRKAEDESGVAGALGYLGVIKKSRGLFKEAENLHREALKIQENLNNESAIAIALGNLGTAIRLQGDSKNGLDCHIRALEIHKKSGDLKSICREYSNLGTAYRHLGNLEESQKYHSKAMDLCEEIGDNHGIAIQHGCLAQICLKRKDYQEAEKHHLKSLKLSQEMKDSQGESIQLKNLGTVYRLSGELTKALEMLNKGLKIDQDRGFNFGIGKAKEGIGKVAVLQGNFDQAKFFFSQALEQFIASSANESIKEIQSLLQLIKDSRFEEIRSMLSD